MRRIAITALAATLCLGGAAQASTVTVNYQDATTPFGPNGNSNNVRIESTGFDGYLSAGAFELTSAVHGDFFAFCIDLAQFLRNGDVYQDDPDLFDSATVENVDRLFSSAYADVTDGVTAAAFQVALWEIISDTGSALDLDSGSFLTVENAAGEEHNGAVETVAQSYLDGLAGAQTGLYELSFLYSATSQDVVTGQLRAPAPVPLPATGLLLLMAAGLTMGVRRFG